MLNNSSPEAYINALNDALRQQPLFEMGMAFLPYPETSHGNGISGYAVTGPFIKMHVYSAAARQVADAVNLKG
jgi:hypothetical protein